MSAILEKKDGLSMRIRSLSHQFQQGVGSHSLISMEFSAEKQLRQIRVIPVKTLVPETHQPVITGFVYSVKQSYETHIHISVDWNTQTAVQSSTLPPTRDTSAPALSSSGPSTT